VGTLTGADDKARWPEIEEGRPVMVLGRPALVFKDSGAPVNFR
jgi:hypothetical protein